MSAMATQKVREPENLYVPPQYTPKFAKKLMDELSPEAGRLFFQEVFEAINEAKTEADLRPINLVVETWFRTLLFQTRPKFDQKWREMEATDGPRMTLEEIQRRRANRIA